MINRNRIENLLEKETNYFVQQHPKSATLHKEAEKNFIDGVPMNWMVKWPGKYPLFMTQANGSRLIDVDNHTFVDFCLGDTGAMTGHCPSLITDKLKAQFDKGFTTMLPIAEVNSVGKALEKRFKLPYWQICISATDANRFALRIARGITKRQYVVTFNYCYHGTVDETLATLDENRNVIPRAGNLGPQVSPVHTTRVVEFNNIDDLENALKDEQVACVLMEPAMTNIGIILPEPGYLEKVRELTKKYGTVLIFDETHTISASPSGYSGKYGPLPDMLTIGKAIGAGIPAGTYGMSAEVAQRFKNTIDYENCDTSGIGGTLSGNPLSVIAIKASLEHILTEENYKIMIEMATVLGKDIQKIIDAYNLPWCVVQLGCRVEYWFCKSVPRNGSGAAAAHDPLLYKYMHLFCLNRGILITPFHNMVLISPNTTYEDIDHHTEVFKEAVEYLVGLKDN
jgi:glutamate-1-semialdehyde 2,1-aminomutase